MEPEPSKLEVRPPALVDAVIRLLIPPACREHVLGDLWERYTSPRQYVIDALRTLPFVICSQMRRTFDPLRSGDAGSSRVCLLRWSGRPAKC